MQTVIGSIEQRCKDSPDHAAIVCGEQFVTYGELWQRVNSVAAALVNLGVRRGDRVLVPAPSTAEFVVGYFAVHLIGAVAVLLDPSAPPARRQDHIQRSRPVLVLEEPDTVHRSGISRSVSIRELIGHSDRQLFMSRPGPDDLADLVFTSGTTGRPKGVRLTHRNLAAAALHINAVIGTNAKDVEVVPLPLYHSFGLGRLRCCLSVGATVVLVQGFRLPGEVFGALERHSATGLAGVPAGFAVLLRFADRGLPKFGKCLRYVEIGSAPMPMSDKRMLMTLLPRTALFMHYGLTEASRSAFIEFHGDRGYLDTVGKPAPGVRVQVRDSGGNVCGCGEEGMLWVSGQHVSPGYWDDVELSNSAFSGGWVRTGDVAHVDERGFIHLHGRQDDMINVGGYNVVPDEVENVLCAHSGVAEAACVGMPDPKGIAGQVVCAYLVSGADDVRVPEEELRAWVTKHLESYKVPVRFEWVTTLPRTASGKIVRAELRAQTRRTGQQEL